MEDANISISDYLDTIGNSFGFLFLSLCSLLLSYFVGLIWLAPILLAIIVCFSFSFYLYRKIVHLKKLNYILRQQLLLASLDLHSPAEQVANLKSRSATSGKTPDLRLVPQENPE